MTPAANSERNTLERAALALLRPVLKLLFERGVSRQTLGRLCDTAYVEASAQRLRTTNQTITLEGVAETSGVPLSHVRRLKRIVAALSESHALPLAEQAPLMAAAERVITGWYTDAAFTDDRGRPLPCNPQEPMFGALLRRYGNGYSVGELVDFLLSTQAVERNDRGALVPRGRHVLAAPHSPELGHTALEALVDLARALEVNRQKHLTGAGALQRTCVSDRIPKRVVPLFRTMIRENTQAFLESIDDWLVQHEAPDDDAGAPLARLGVGVYVVADE